METNQRSSRYSTDDMPTTPESAFSLPAGKEKISARIASDTKKRLNAIVEIWKAQTRVEKEAEARALDLDTNEAAEFVKDAVQNVDLTFVVDRLLARATQVELAQWGGFPDSQEKLAAMVKQILRSAK